jgi:hypothetical protein
MGTAGSNPALSVLNFFPVNDYYGAVPCRFAMKGMGIACAIDISLFLYPSSYKAVLFFPGTKRMSQQNDIQYSHWKW